MNRLLNLTKKLIADCQLVRFHQGKKIKVNNKLGSRFTFILKNYLKIYANKLFIKKVLHVY